MMKHSSFTISVFVSFFTDHLNTVSLRPTLMYGESDERFLPTIMKLADRWNGTIPRICEGGKKQTTYVGRWPCQSLKFSPGSAVEESMFCFANPGATKIYFLKSFPRTSNFSIRSYCEASPLRVLQHVNCDCWHFEMRQASSLTFFLFSFLPLPERLMCTGNVAWAHLCAKNKLKSQPKAVSGLPIFITDDSPVTDAVRFTQRVNADMDLYKIKPTSWAFPFLLCYMLAMLLEMSLKVINVFVKLQVSYCPRGLLAYGSSLVLYDRLRSSISLEYEPIYTVSEGFSRSAKWYDGWYQNFKNNKLTKRHSNWSAPRERAVFYFFYFIL